MTIRFDGTRRHRHRRGQWSWTGACAGAGEPRRQGRGQRLRRRPRRHRGIADPGREPWSRKSARPAAPRWPTAPTSPTTSRSRRWWPRHPRSGAASICSRQRRYPARQVVRQDGDRRLRQSARRASHRHLLLLQGGVGRHARAQLRPYRHHHLVVGPVREFRPGATTAPPKPALERVDDVLAEEGRKNNIRVKTIPTVRKDDASLLLQRRPCRELDHHRWSKSARARMRRSAPLRRGLELVAVIKETGSQATTQSFRLELDAVVADFDNQRHVEGQGVATRVRADRADVAQAVARVISCTR